MRRRRPADEHKVLRVTGRKVRVAYTKYDGSLHWHHDMRYLGEDQHGVWLGAPAGTFTQRGDEPPIRWDHNNVVLVPRDRWWTAAFTAEPAECEVYCDITTPARWPHDGEVTMVDLDLDVLRLWPDHSVMLDDEDEFEEHQVRYGYPAEVISQARMAAAWLMQAVSDGTEPFASGYQEWLGRLGRLASEGDLGCRTGSAGVDSAGA